MNRTSDTELYWKTDGLIIYRNIDSCQTDHDIEEKHALH